MGYFCIIIIAQLQNPVFFLGGGGVVELMVVHTAGCSGDWDWDTAKTTVKWLVLDGGGG